MPKRKLSPMEEEMSLDMLNLSSKKHKKHKHKKHKRRKEDGDGEGSENSEGAKPGLKLKIRFGGQQLAETDVSKSDVNDASSDEEETIDVVGGADSNIPKRMKKVNEEDAWLEALEAGRLEEVDEELRRMKDPSLMTARQRSLFESKAQKEKEEVVVTETVALSEEMIQKKIIKAKKRKEQAQEKLMKDKKQTLERLLKRPDRPVKKSDSKPKTLKKEVKKIEIPKMKYIDSKERGKSLILPLGFSYPIKPQVAKDPPPPSLCGVQGCANHKKYSCSKTGVPLCSLACYKKNINLCSPAFQVT